GRFGPSEGRQGRRGDLVAVAPARPQPQRRSGFEIVDVRGADGGEVFGYGRKTDTTFEDLTRGLYGTSTNTRLGKGRLPTSFEAMLTPAKMRKDAPRPSREMRDIIKDEDSPLLLQRSTDLYTVVVRLPARPHLRRSGEAVQLIPGENHWETYGFHIFRDGKKITDKPVRPGTSLELPGEGTYTASAVEWSGLESQPSLPLKVSPAEGACRHPHRLFLDSRALSGAGPRCLEREGATFRRSRSRDDPSARRRH
ncbi:MAG: hypothetical protein ACC645_10535, partial [Pirellulales bacterium]